MSKKSLNIENSHRNEKHSEIINELISNGLHGLLYLPTRYGKTRIILKSLEGSCFKSILWVCGTVIFRDKGLQAECKKWNIKKSVSNNMTAICYASLESINPDDYDCIILDEIQKITVNNSLPLYDFKGVILGATGTPPRSSEKQKILRDLNLVPLISKSVDDAVNEKMISDYEVDVVSCSLNFNNTIEKKGKNGTFYTSEKKMYDWYCKKIAEAIDNNDFNEKRSISLGRAKFIYGLNSKLNWAKKIMNKYRDSRVISFSKSISHAETLSPNVYHSKMKKKDREKVIEDFNSGKINTLGTVEAANTSITLNNLDIAFIHQLDSNPENYGQRAGRNLNYKEGLIKKIIILCVKDTQDMVWVGQCLKNLSASKINYYEIQDYL